MHQFKDSSNRPWALSVNISSVKRVRSMLGVDLLAINVGEPPLVMQLDTDPVLLVDVLYVLLKPDLDSAGISDEQFGAALGGDAFDAAREAFWSELTDFFRGLRRAEMVSLIVKARAAVATMIDVGREEIDTDTSDLREKLKAEIAKQKNAPTSTPSSTSSPASSAATPAP